MLVAAIVLISLALVFYTTGIFTERRSGTLKWSHAAWFAAGLAFDGTGTYLMTRIAASGGTAKGGLAAVLNQLMAITGALALLLMAVHLIWAITVLLRDRESEKKQFHRFSLGVWLAWLVPYFAGSAAAMIG